MQTVAMERMEGEDFFAQATNLIADHLEAGMDPEDIYEDLMVLTANAVLMMWMATGAITRETVN